MVRVGVGRGGVDEALQGRLGDGVTNLYSAIVSIHLTALLEYEGSTLGSESLVNLRDNEF